MSNEHSLTGEHVLRAAFDSATKSLKSKMIPMEMSVELSHVDGDSVYAHKPTTQLSLAANTSGSILGTTKVTIYSTASKTVSIAADATETWFVVGTTNSDGLLTIDVCAHQIKCADACKIVAV